jgi:hypothetical protein
MPQLLLFMMLSCLAGLARTIYGLNDLEVLVAENSTQEFFEHALDVRPSERLDRWKAMVTKMGDIHSRKILDKAEIEAKDFQNIENLYRIYALKTDDVFKIRRSEIGLRYLKRCLKSQAPCWSDLKIFWENDKTDAETAFKLAELTRQLEGPPLSSWSLLEVALKSPLSEFYCKKEFVMSALWGKIEMDYIKLGPDGDLMAKIDQTIHPDCVPILIEESRKRLYRPPKISDRELAYQILKSQLKAEQEVTDFFLTVYLLDNPSQGELFNFSWNRVKELGDSFERRDKVLKILKRFDTLPDNILGSLDQTKKRVIINHFKTYFPEYLDYYSDECIKFYGGKGTFPKGNPTLHCQDFMSSELAPKVIDQFRIKQYQEVKKI